MKKNIITLCVCLLSLVSIIMTAVIFINMKNKNRTLKFKDGMGNTIIELGEHKTSQYEESKKSGWRCDFGIDSYDEFVSFMKNSSCYDATLCFDCTTQYSVYDIDTKEETFHDLVRTVGYIVKDGYLFCYDIHSNYAEFELVVNPYTLGLDDKGEIINLEPYIVCDKHMYSYGDITKFMMAPCWRCGISFDNIKNIYGKLPNMVAEINESERSITVYAVNPKTYEINKNQKVKMTFDEKSFITCELVD